MAENKNNLSIFSGVNNAINKNKKRTPIVQNSGVIQNINNPQSSQSNNIEHVQQQFLDWQVNKIAHDLYTRTIYYDTDRINAYQDFRAMDMSPEIAAALSIMRDECLEADTIIPLLNGEKITIEELYNKCKENFYVYSYNPDQKKVEPALCERVAYKGEQDVYKIIFDDDSFVMATSEHLWLIKSESKYLTTSELSIGQSIEPFYTRISTSEDRIKGYEMVLESGKWEYTHRILKRNFWPEKKGVVHHKDIRKLNNDPSNLEVMGWFEHKELHYKLNSDRWKNDKEYSEKMKKIISETNSINGPYWTDKNWREKRVNEMSKRRKEKYASFTSEELKKRFGYPGEKNPMYKNGFKLKGEKNGRYINEFKRDFKLYELIDAYNKTNNLNDACKLLNTNPYILRKSKIYNSLNIQRWEDLGFIDNNISIDSLNFACNSKLGELILENSFEKICNDFNWNSRKVITFLNKNGYRNWFDFVKPFNSKKAILDRIKKSVLINGITNLSEICRKENLDRKKIEGLIARSKYKNWNNFLNNINHSIKSIEFVGKRKTYDLVNVGNHHNFAILTSNGTGVFTHNCITRGERGKILDIYSENQRVKTVLEDLFYNRLDIDFALKLWIRDLLKYGDFYLHLHIDKDEGIYDFMSLPPEEIHREEGYEGRTDNVRFKWETTGQIFDDWQVAHFRLLEDTRKLPYGRCLKYDTYVETNKGPKFIKDIQKNDLVWTFNKNTQEKELSSVLDVVCSGEKDIYKIRTKNNEIESSLEHNVMVFENGDFIYKPVCDLKLKDLLVINKEFCINKEIIINKNFNFSEKNYNGYRNSQHNIPDIVDEEFSKFFGFMLGDGWCSNNTVCIALGLDEDINNEYIRLLEKFSGKKVFLKENPNEKGTLKYSQAWVNSKMLKEVLLLNGFVGKSWEKRLPEWVFRADTPIKESLIQGLIDSDGSINIDKYNCKRYAIELVSEYLVKDLKYLLQTMGRKTGKICTRKRKNTKIWGEYYKKRKCFYMYFYDSKIKQSANCDLENRKTDDFIIAPIISIEKLEKKEYVYDIHVESENHNFYANGIVVHNSILDPARKLWKQLQLAEDSMLVYRITRAPERRVFYIDVGNLENADVAQFVQQFQMQLKKQPIVDQKTGNMNLKYNPMNVTEDYFIPMRAERSSRIETLPGANNLGDIQDIEYFQNKLFASLQVPKNYLNYGQSLPGGSTLSQQDLRFARTINTIQQAILAELKRIANIHLYFNGFKDDIDNFTLSLNNPSTQQELLKLETMKARLEVFKEMFSAEATSPVSYVWAMENILGFSKSEIKLILKQKKVEKKIFAEIDSAVEMYKKIGLFKDLDDRYEIEGAEEMMQAQQSEEEGGDSGGGFGGGSSFGGGDFGGDDLGGDDLGGDDLGGDDLGGEPSEEAPLAESKFRRIQRKSDFYVDKMLNELLGEDEKPKKPKIEDNALIKRSNSMRSESQKLINKINNSLEERGLGKGVIQEEVFFTKNNSLIEGSEKLEDENQKLMDEIESFLRNRNK